MTTEEIQAATESVNQIAKDGGFAVPVVPWEAPAGGLMVHLSPPGPYLTGDVWLFWDGQQWS